MRCGGREAGMTLLELMVGIVIIGIIAGVATPNIRSYRETQRLASSSDRIAAVCKAAQAQARSENHNILIEVRIDDGIVAVIDDENGNGTADVGEAVTEHPVASGTHVASTTFADDTLIYDSHGRASNGGTILLQGGSDDIMPRRVEVATGTGHIKIRGGEEP